MKTRFKTILHLVALLAMATAFAWIVSERDLSAIPLFCLGLATLVLPVCADSIRDDIEIVTMEELSYYLKHNIKGKYIAKDGDKYIAVIVEDVTTFQHFETRGDCIKWMDKRVKEMK